MALATEEYLFSVGYKKTGYNTYDYNKGNIRKVTVRYDPDAIEGMIRLIVMQRLKNRNILNK